MFKKSFLRLRFKNRNFDILLAKLKLFENFQDYHRIIMLKSATLFIILELIKIEQFDQLGTF
jgi:hypothetical protein